MTFDRSRMNFALPSVGEGGFQFDYTTLNKNEKKFELHGKPFSWRRQHLHVCLFVSIPAKSSLEER